MIRPEVELDTTDEATILFEPPLGNATLDAERQEPTWRRGPFEQPHMSRSVHERRRHRGSHPGVWDIRSRAKVSNGFQSISPPCMANARYQPRPKADGWMLWLGILHGRDSPRRWVLVGLRSIDFPTALPGQGDSTFPHQPSDGGVELPSRADPPKAAGRSL